MRTQSLRDKVLWELACYGGKMMRSELRRRMGIKYEVLDPILEELVEEGRISQSTLPTGKEMITEAIRRAR
jgi:DNA-binding HxlR family transcriptional regulator